MPIIPAKCTECGRILQADQEKNTAVCPQYNFSVEKAINYYRDLPSQTDFAIHAGELLQYNGKDTDVIIPDTVAYIGDRAFMDCVHLCSAAIPASVHSVRCSAFSGCSNLTSIVIPDSVTFIGEHAFTAVPI